MGRLSFNLIHRDQAGFSSGDELVPEAGFSIEHHVGACQLPGIESRPGRPAALFIRGKQELDRALLIADLLQRQCRHEGHNHTALAVSGTGAVEIRLVFLQNRDKGTYLVDGIHMGGDGNAVFVIFKGAGASRKAVSVSLIYQPPQVIAQPLRAEFRQNLPHRVHTGLMMRRAFDADNPPPQFQHFFLMGVDKSKHSLLLFTGHLCLPSFPVRFC